MKELSYLDPILVNLWRDCYKSKNHHEKTIVLKGNEVEIDLSSFRYINFPSLLSLCSLIEYCIDQLNIKVIIIFPELNEELKKIKNLISKLENLDDKKLSKELIANSIYISIAQFRDSARVFNFLSFLYNIGFIELWDFYKNDNKIELRFFPRDDAKLFFKYKGISNIHQDTQSESFRRYTKIHRIREAAKSNETIKDIVKEMEERLPSDHKNSSLFQDNEFENVFLTHLTDNVENHAKSDGFVIARSFSHDDLIEHIELENILEDCSEILRSTCKEKGFFQIIISDCGEGICETLRSAYEAVLSKILETHKRLKYNDEEIIQFALDEFGSRYLSNNDEFVSLIDQHSLNQLYQYTRKYSGLLNILTHEISLIFDTSKNIKRGTHGFGFAGVRKRVKCFHGGVLINVILPHDVKSPQNYPKARKVKWPEGIPLQNQNPSFVYLGSDLGAKPSLFEIRFKANEIAKEAIAKKYDKIAFDFTGTSSWDSNRFLEFLISIKNIISSFDCWGINVPYTIINTLKNRWSDNNPYPIPEEERLLALPCLCDNEEFYLLAKDTMALSDSLLMLFNKEKISDDFILPQYTLSEILDHINSNMKSNFTDNELYNILAHHTNLFEKNKLYWNATIDIYSMYQSSKNLMKDNFLRLLKTTNSIYKGIDKETEQKFIFQLPSTLKYFDEFIWTYKLLQNGEYTDQIATRLKNILNKNLAELLNINLENQFGAIITLTAPARILAEAISRLYKKNPSVIDFGTISELDIINIRNTFSKIDNKSCIIITDVLNTKTLLHDLIQILEESNINVLAVASIINFVDPGNEGWVEDIEYFNYNKEEEDDKLNKDFYPTAILYNYPKPTEIEVEDFSKYKVFWIEPYSLNPFPREFLESQSYTWDKEERNRNIPQKICSFDKKGYILYGHFKDGHHHNRILIHSQNALQDSEITEDVSDDIIEIIKDKPPSVIIIPLHSNIHFFIPYLKSKLRDNSIGLPIICSIPIDLKGRGPYYLIPEEAQNILRHVKSKRIMFLDDGILTGRTLETFIRAIILFVERNDIKLQHIYSYCIVNRVGRAATTKWRKLSQIKVITKNSNTFFIPFSFNDFIRFECPVYSANDCPLCKSKDRIEEYTKYKFKDKSIEWVNEEIDFLTPVTLGTDAYRKAKGELINNNNELINKNNFLLIDIPLEKSNNEITIKSIEGILWWFWEKSYRGTPGKYLLETFYDWINNESSLTREAKKKLLSEVILWSLDNLSDIRKMGFDSKVGIRKSHLPEILKKLIYDFLKIGGTTTPRILEKLAHVLSNNPSINKSKFGDIYDIFNMILESIRIQDDFEIIDSILLGTYLFIARIDINGLLKTNYEKLLSLVKEFNTTDLEKRGYYKAIRECLSCQVSDDEYLYSLLLLCEERYRPSQHKLLLSTETSKLTNPSKPINQFSYLPDSALRLASACSIFFNQNIFDDHKLTHDVAQISNLAKKISLYFRDKPETKDRFKLLEWVTYFNNLICDKSIIGSMIDLFNPCINEVLFELKNDYIDEINNNIIGLPDLGYLNISIIGEKGRLKDTLRNHIWSVLNQHKKPNHKIKIIINDTETEDYVILYIYNSYYNVDEALNLMKKGDSTRIEKMDWLKYKAMIEYPTNSNLPKYLSMMKLQFLKGYKIRN